MAFFRVSAIAVSLAASAAFAGSFSNCIGEFTDLLEEYDFDALGLVKDLAPLAVKVKAQAKMPLQFIFGPGDDSKVTNIGITVGCLKALPESPAEIQSMLMDIVKAAKAEAIANVKKTAKDAKASAIATAAKQAYGSEEEPAAAAIVVNIAVAEAEIQAESSLAKEFRPSELRYMTNEIRRAAINNLPKPKYSIMPEQSAQDSADFIAKGVVGKFRKNYTFIVEVYNKKTGMLALSSDPAESEKAEDLLSGFRDVAPAFFKRLEDELGGFSKTPAAAPAKVLKKNRLVIPDDTYKWVKMPKNGKIWMVENMNVAMGNSACYQNSESYCQRCGRLYNLESARKICPKGWHLPSDAEWDALEKAVGGYSTAGIALKSKAGWNNNGNGMDKHGFSALACGYRYGNSFSYYGYATGFWSDDGSIRSLYANETDMGKDDSENSDLYSVRCVAD